MPDKDQPKDGPSLEMPSFSLRRKKATAQEPEPAPGPTPDPAPEPGPDSEPTPESEPALGPEAEPEPVRRPARDGVRLPDVSGIVAALVTGAVVGGLAAAAVWLSTTTCDAVRGTSSCGGGPGLVILFATMLLLACLGGWMLRAFGVSGAVSTSFMGLGLAVVVLLTFFSQSLDEAWMAAVATVMTMAGYALAWWVTSQVDQADPPRRTG